MSGGRRTRPAYDHRTDILTAAFRHTDYLHETIHFLDHISTPYGLFLDELLHVEFVGFLRLFHDLNDPDAPSIPVPLASHLENFESLLRHLEATAGDSFDVEAFGDFLRRQRPVQAAFDRLRTALEGGNPEVDQYPTTLALFELLDEEFELNVPSLAQLEGLRLGDWPSAGESDPILPGIFNEVIGEGELFGAHHLLEARALWAQEALGGVPNELFHAAIEAQKYDYIMAIALLNDALTDAGIGFTKDEYIHTFMCLSDCALYVPVGRIHGRLRRRNEWKEVHPGWRFLSMLKRFGDFGLFDGSDETHLLDYQDRVAGVMDWASPREHLEAGSRLEPRHYREHRHKLACEAKLQWPTLFIDPLLPAPDRAADHQAFLDELGPFEVDVDDPSWTDVGTVDPEQVLERIAVLFFVGAGNAYMTSHAPESEAFLDPTFPYDAHVSMPSGLLVEEHFRSEFLEHVETTNGLTKPGSGSREPGSGPGVE